MQSKDDRDRRQQEREYRGAVTVGVFDATAGRLVDHAEVAKWLATWGSATESAPPRKI